MCNDLAVVNGELFKHFSEDKMDLEKYKNFENTKTWQDTMIFLTSNIPLTAYQPALHVITL